MRKIQRVLNGLEQTNESIKVAIVGFGKMGSTLVHQLLSLRGYRPSVIVSGNLDRVVNRLISFGVDRDRIVMGTTLGKINDGIRSDKIVLTEDYRLASQSEINAVVDATGSTSYGTNIAIEAIENKKSVIMLNVECDATVGPYLHRLALENGVVYTGSAGDEPGAIIELIEFVDSIGLELAVVGKGKNNLLDVYITNDELESAAREKSVSVSALTSFCDGTNTMIELTAVGNAIGFMPDVVGGHGVSTDVKNLGNVFSKIDEGGVLSGYGVVDYAFGVAPGVFAIARAKSEVEADLLKYLNMGEGPNYVFHRPYHLTSMETPMTIYKAVIEGDSTISPECGQVCDTITYAKRDIKVGERLEGIGGDTVFGKITSNADAVSKNALPIGLITEKAVAVVDIAKGSPIDYSMVQLDESEVVVQVRRKQDKYGVE